MAAGTERNQAVVDRGSLAALAISHACEQQLVRWCSDLALDAVPRPRSAQRANLHPFIVRHEYTLANPLTCSRGENMGVPSVFENEEHELPEQLCFGAGE
jgi:hypothetical protein